MSSGACAYPWQQINVDLTGEVVPCCFWSGYGNSGKPLGNTNVRTLDEIWNGEAYQKLRRANASGQPPADHPCHECLGWQWSGGIYPKFSWPVSFEQETGHCFSLVVPDRFCELAAAHDEPVLLYEGASEMPRGDAIHDEIRALGEGRYSFWKGTLFFSSSDNSDARTNGRDYELRCGPHSFSLANFKPDCVSGRNIAAAHEEYDRGEPLMAAAPTMASFIATADCNIDCPACSQNTVRLLKVQHREQTELQILKLVPQLTQLIWHGGEPYLIRRFREFIDGFRTEHNPNLTFGFTSNGTLLNAAELEKLDQFPRINATISIDSFARETFDVIRSGANFDTVVANLLRAVERYEAPDFLMHVGMIITKTNLTEMADNLRFAMEHDIGINLSPVVVYPAPEQLDVFEDFAAQTRGWRAALDEAAGVLEDARARGAPALRRIDPTGHVKAIEAILDQAAERYDDIFSIAVTVEDPDQALGRMRRPGVVVASDADASHPLAYVVFDRGPGSYELQLPRQALSGPNAINWYLLHDLYEPMGVIDMEPFFGEDGLPPHKSGWRAFPASLYLKIPRFEPLSRPRNVQLANFGLPTADGLQVSDPLDMLKAQRTLQQREFDRGLGPQDRLSWEDHKSFGNPLWYQRYQSYRSLV